VLKEIDMSETKLMETLNFDDADLASNRLGQLTQKQRDLLVEKAKSHKSFNTAIGVVIAVIFGGSLLTGLAAPLIATLGGSFLTDGKITTEAMLTSLPFICMGLFFLVVFGGILFVVLKLVFEKANRKVDTAVRRAEGKVNFVWVERRERNTSKTGSTYRTVRVLEMRIGGDTFTVNQELPNIINQGEEWIFYYTNHPFKFLSAEKTN
jgi:hypothetical protein